FMVSLALPPPNEMRQSAFSALARCHPSYAECKGACEPTPLNTDSSVRPRDRARPATSLERAARALHTSIGLQTLSRPNSSFNAARAPHPNTSRCAGLL